MRWASALVLGVWLSVGVTATPQDALSRATPESMGLSSAGFLRVSQLLQEYVAARKVPGVVAAVARQGRVVFLEAHGVQDLKTGAPMSDRSIFRIYSMTKAVTAVAVMRLHEEGRFQLTDPVSKYLQEFKDVSVVAQDGVRTPTRDMTIRDLLLHTSGLDHRTSESYRRARVRSRTMPTAQVVSNIARMPLREDPGTRWRYSESPTVLGRLVEVWSGKALDEFLDDKLFRPLRMVDTGFWARPTQVPRLTTVHTPTAAGGLEPLELEEVPVTERPALLEGAVGLLSTVPDYLRFCQMLLNKGELDGVRILSPKTVEMMTENALPDTLVPIDAPGTGWALANVRVVPDPTVLPYPTTTGEYEWGGSAGTSFLVDPQEGVIAIIMAPISPANPDALWDRFRTLVYRTRVE